MTPESEYIMGTCHKCGRPWLAGHVCDEISKQAREAMDDVVAASIEAAKRLFPEETGEPVFVGHAPDQTVSGVERGQGVWLAKVTDQTPHPVTVFRLAHERGYLPTHIAFPTDEASLAQMRERIEHLVQDHEGGELQESDRQLADAVMRMLFGDTP